MMSTTQACVKPAHQTTSPTEPSRFARLGSSRWVDALGGDNMPYSKELMESRNALHIGKRFSRLVISKFHHRDGRGMAFYLCVCDCGNKIVTRLSGLKDGHAKSCGCLQKEKVSNVMRSHGFSCGSSQFVEEYHAWIAMKARCYNEKCKSYSGYGGRGISICERWRESVGNFISDMGKKPGPDYSIDRINNDGNYEPDNCRWTTMKVQSNNRRKRRNV